MKLPIPSFARKEKQKYILALLLRDEKISALITEEVEGIMRIVGQHEEMLGTPLEKLSEEEWLDVLDRTISKAEDTLPPDRETHDTVFGVKESWVEDKKIKKEYLLQLKKISEALDLTPIGFLVISEAISHLIQAEEGAPVSAILVDIGKLSVTATLVRGGKVLESKSVHREESLPRNVDTALKHFHSVDVFPSRVILFSGSSPVGERENIEHLAQSFISHHWSKSLPFLHAPQISVLNGGFDAKAVVQGAASQMGFEILNLTTSREEEIKNFNTEDKDIPTKAGVEENLDAEPTDGEEKVHGKHTNDANEESSGEDFGFILDQDVSEQKVVKADNFEHVASGGHAETAEHHKDASHHKDVLHHGGDLHPASAKDHETALHSEGDSDYLNNTEEKNNPARDGTEDDYNDENRVSHSGYADDPHESSSPLAKITGMFSLLPGIVSSLPLNRLKVPLLLSGPGKKLLIIPVALLVLIGIAYYLYTTNLKAEVTLFLKPNNVTETSDVLFSTDSGNDFTENVIAAKTVDTDIDGTVSTNATGKKAIGEKAKGSVTVYNNDSAKKQITSGTTITTEKGLKFTVDKDVTIASASGDIFSGTKPGTAQVAVSASEFGSDYNLPSGTKFNVSGASNVAAKNDTAFSGGSKKEVTVVSKKDQDKLLAELSRSLQEKALDDLSGKVTGEQKLLRFLTQATVSSRKFDRKVDEEAKKVTLSGTVSFEALTYNQKDLEDFAKVALKNKYSDNLNLSEKGLSVALKNEKQKDEGEVAADLTIGAGLIPKIDTASLVDRIRGKSVTDAEQELRKIPQVAKAEITLSPSLPFIPVSLPKREEKIVLNTALDE